MLNIRRERRSHTKRLQERIIFNSRNHFISSERDLLLSRRSIGYSRPLIHRLEFFRLPVQRKRLVPIHHKQTRQLRHFLLGADTFRALRFGPFVHTMKSPFHDHVANGESVVIEYLWGSQERRALVTESRALYNRRHQQIE